MRSFGLKNLQAHIRHVRNSTVTKSSIELMLFPVCDDAFPVMSERGDGEAVRVFGQKRHTLPDPSTAAPRPGRLLLTSNESNVTILA